MDVEWLDPDERTAWLTLARASNLLLDELERELYAEHGLLLGDYEILARLANAGCGLRLSDLAARVLVSRSRLTHRMNRLEEQELVQRVPCANDGRVTYAVLTAAGRARLEAAAPTHVAGLRRHLLERLDRAELRSLTDSLAKVLAGFGEDVPRGEPAGIPSSSH